MGSTGGGHSGGGGGHVSIGHHGSSGSSYSGPWYWVSVVAIIAMNLFPYAAELFRNQVRPRLLASKYWPLKHWMFGAGITIREFEDNMFSNQLFMSDDLNDNLEETLIDCYSTAQYTYSQAIRGKYTGSKTGLAELKKYLIKDYYKTMDKEIVQKAKSGIIDDININQATIERACQLTNKAIVVLIKAKGSDREVNQKSGFESSFRQDTWEDYVIYYRENGVWKIANIVYGEHFHLNGKDYNHQASLDKDSTYEERKL